uniref:C2H2-type domain-containing protein n=1 Tax=Cyprinus carpio TaxID=7962 RepID=A0A8C2FL88_CYPCA
CASERMRGNLKKSPEHFHNVCLEPVAVNNLAKFAEKEKDNTQQREAVIRPQQAGKIDFKSLQNHSFNSNRTWSSGKDSPQSPSGKSRNRDKSKKSGKGERGNPQQLYRLSITNPRSNPTIGIAYPQQKVSPPKKIESSRGPVSGSYRFHVPSIPEREAELQQEELQFRCFQESSPNLTSQSYTSQAVATPSGGPKPNPIESNSTQPANENLFPDFQLSEIDTWQSPDRTFRSTSFGLTSQKPNNLVDFNKTNGSFMPMPFQYGYPLLEESGSDSFPCDRNTQSQDYIDISPAPNQVSHNSFSFPSSAEGHEAIQRVLIQGSVHHIRNISQGSSSQIHVISPPHNGIHISPGPLDKSVSKHHVRVSHPWNGPNKAFPPPLIDQTSTPYPFQYQPAPEQRQNSINGRMPWQQIRFTTAMPSQNRIDLSRQLSNQQLTFLIGPSDWQDDSKPHKNSQVGDAKNKSLYFGINPSVPVTSSRNCSYPPLHVAPLGLKMVSPYDSPSHSPTQNPTSSSTCPSLSPASTNSVNSNSDDSQISKVLSPQFYQQQQDKALISSSSMNTNQHHYHSEASRGLHYKQEKSKENIASFMSHNRHSKSNMDNGKGCLETYRPENHPPPPYSAHQLATSLVSANLDQLDVLLTCKQCDQNFNNLVSFLDHKQYCGQHTFAQNDFKDVPKVEDIRNSSDLHLSLLGLNKNGEIVPDNETKGDIKDDPMKLMLPSAPLPDLEMEDPKLDSLITEALNGLGYQSDNAEIDSSFIDAFVDDDLTTTKCTSTRQTLTAKDSTTFEGRTNSESTSSERSEAHSKYPFDSDLDSLSSDSKLTDSPFKEKTASEHTMTKSTVSLARFKTTRVEIEEKGDHYGFEAGILATTEEPFKKDYPKNITSPRGSGIKPNPVETTNNRDSSHVLKLQKDAVTSKDKSHKKTTSSSEFSAPFFEKACNDSISNDEASRSSNDLFPDPAPLCSSLVDKVCLSPSKVHDATAQKNGQCLIPYSSEHDQSLIKSPLSFDTTSMFGDLSVGGFENNLYPDIQLAKESFSPLETTTDKKELFESSFSPFLEQRDWNLMVDVTPVLPDEISQYKEDSDSNENKTNFNHVPFALPEKLMDYNPNLNSSVSVDDLEIKRIVTELESQLQTAKLSSPPPLDSDLPKPLTMSKFSPLRLDPDSEEEDSSLEMNCSSENLQIARQVDSQSELFSEPDLPWSSPLPFGLMCGQQGLHTPMHPSTTNTPTDSEHDHLDAKDGMGLTVLNTENGSPTHLKGKTEKNDCLDKSEEMLEHEIYTENLMKSLEVISDSLSSGFTSPQSSPNQESVVPEEHDKQDHEHSKQKESEHMESRNTEAELTKFSVETSTFNTSTAKLEETTSDISGSGNRTKVSLNETSNDTLHNELVANEQQLAESSFESPQTTYCMNSKETDSKKPECDTQFGIKDSNYAIQNPDFSKIFHFSASPTIPKDDNILCVGKTQKFDEDSALIANPELISEDNGHASDKTGGTTDCLSKTDIQQPISNIKSPHCEDHFSTHSQLNNTQQVVSPKHLPVVQDDHECTANVERAMPDMTLFSEQSECEANQQKNTEQSSKLLILNQAPEFSYNSIQSPSELKDNGPLPSTVTPALSKNRPALEDKNSDQINIGKSHIFDPATTELDHSFNPHLDLVEITESNISSPGTLLTVDKISKQPFSENSGALDDSQDTGALYDLKLSPLNYNETSFSDYNFTSKCLNKEQPDVKSNSTDSYILNVCAFSLDEPSSSAPTYNANEQEPNIQGHLTGLDIPETSINNNDNDIKYSSVLASCSNYVEEGRRIDSEQVLKLNQTDMNGSHLPPETVDYMDLHLKFHKKADSAKLDHQMISSENDTMQRSTMLDIKEIPNPLIHYAKAASMGLTFTSVQNEGPSPNEKKTSPKKGGTQNAVQGKFQCEICAMFFRTQPGLKRHKAMKHVVKTEGISPIENLNMSSQMFMPILMPQPTEKALKGCMDVISPAVLSHSNRSEISDGQGQQADPHLIFQGIPSDSDVSTIPESCNIDQTTTLNEKANNRNTTVDMSSEMFAPKLVKQDTFSDEILSTLKTDILQAISPDFASMVQQNCPKSPEKQVPNSSHSYHEVGVREEHKSMVVTISCEEQKEETSSSIGHSILHKKGDTYDIEDVVTKYCAITPKYVQTEDVHYPLGDSSVAIKRENTCSPAEDSHPLTGTLGIGPDLKAFFDDESTFSQLFPRNDDRKRKKCARVYGKSNKKQKLSCLILDCPPTGAFIDKDEESKENKFSSVTNDPCEYETIEITPKSLLNSSKENACHSKDDLMDDLKLQAGYEENVETGIKVFLWEKEGTIRQPLEHQDDSHDCIVPENTFPLEDCKSVVPATAGPLQMVCVQENGSCSPSNEVPNFNTTIQLPVPFFEPEREMTLVETITSTEQKGPERLCKKPVERKCRKRIEPGLKPKHKQYKCKVCFTWFLTLGELDFHKLSHNPSPPPTCYMCVQRKFSSREQLRDHLREKHAKNKAGVWTCGMCLKEISDVWMYNEHLREHATQFARRGQSQSSLLDMPGCFMQENAVKNFISSIMQHRASRATKGDNLKSLSKEERRTSLDVNGQELKGPEEFDSISLKTKMSIGGGSKHCALTTLEVLPKAETPSKNAEMHPNCKDPSRDCHHCGKQFPKPFKLQRHLVVHSLQKIFLCHKCPVSYQEAKELKDHLKHEHEETDEPDSKHTTLYTCELCADVMHVIKKSFICSTCNYTFSKKEQFDRHMEKHLAGGNKIFKFRRVMRPCRPFNSKDDISDMPPSKKRKATESSLDITVSHMQGIKSVLPIIDDTAQNSTEEHSTETNNTSVKIEDVAEDFPVVAKDIIECTVQTDTAEQSLSTELKKEDESSSPSHELQTDEPREVSATDKEALTEICDVKIEDDCCTIPTTLLDSEVNVASISRQNEDGVETNPSESLENASEQGETTDSSVCTIQVCSQTDVSLPKQDMQGLSSCNDFELSSVKQSSNETSYLKQDQTIETLFSINRNENIQDVHTHDSEQPATAHAKHITMVKSEETLKQSLENNPRCLSTTDSARHTNSSCEDKDSAKQQKKRKELKTSHSSQRTPSPTARENLGIDPRFKKKFRPSRCENIDGQRKTDLPNDYPVLTSVKDDTVSNKIISKHKIGSSNLGLHLKKGPVEFSPKKVEIVRHFNGDCKGKKSIPRRPVHSTSSRVSTLNNSFNKSRSKPGVRSIETHSYRTAESQNNLLSQLFGQRLTSFKIPLRKDTSESIKD